MEIREVTQSEYGEIIKYPFHVFGSSLFNGLNKDKCDEVLYFLFFDTKFRLGLVGGVSNGSLSTPFSAPFGGFSFVHEDVRLQHIEMAIDLLKDFILKKGIKSIRITLPPEIYSRTFVTKEINSLFRKGFSLEEVDLNYYVDLAGLNEGYPEHSWYNARKNLKISMSSGLTFRKATDQPDSELAYEIIRQNRESRGFPLKMSWTQIWETSGIIPSDFFIVSKADTPVASAIVFGINNDSVLVVYWGDIPGISELKPVNFLSYKIFEHYKIIGKRFVDIGPSSEFSTPNYGLCEFKESIGCNIGSKLTFIFENN